MNSTFKKTLIAAAISLPALGATAEINVDFETPQSYKAIGVWDAWEHSPFRLGELQGNYAVTANPDRNPSEVTGQIPNDSEKVLGAQRSRFGSNRFGVKIDLPETFELVPQVKYVHVMLYKTETAGRVMLMGLGSRQERKGQDPYTLQFSTMASNAIEPGSWFDAVFAVKGAGGIDIRSLVVVPDCESPHARTSDFLFYVDNIAINDSPVPRISNEYYPVFGSKSIEMTRTDRGAKGIYMVCGNDTVRYAYDQNSAQKLYADLTSKTFYAKPGQTVTPGIDYAADWMHGYCYVDYGNDGNFNTSNEFVSYNYYQGKNSKGESAQRQLGKNKAGVMPSFTVPADTKPGMYRIRFKIDWDSIDPAGNPGDAEGKNIITDNAGAIFDAMLCVYGDKVTVNDFQLNGEVLAANGDKLNAYQVEADKPFAIKSAPEKGFHNGGVNLNFGFNLNGEPTDKYGNPQFVTVFVPASSFSNDDVYTIPANLMRGDLLINGNMVEDGPAGPCAEGYFLYFPEDLKMTRDDRKLNSLSLATPEGTVTINIPAADSKSVYQNMLAYEVPVMAGETVTPSVSYNGNAMHTYWYVDLNEDGSFSNDLNADGTPAGEMLSYSHYGNKNSLGGSVEKPGGINPTVNHPFVIPAGTPEGIYRCRLKIDWSNVDPGGNYGNGSNDIDANGGYVVDFMIHVHGATAAVSSNSKLTVNGQGLPYAAPRKQNITVASTTADGKQVEGVTARYGYHLDSERSTRYSHVYWRETRLTANADGSFTVPAEITDRPVLLIAEETNGLTDVEVTASEADKTYDLQGRRVAVPARGLYIQKGRKLIAR